MCTGKYGVLDDFLSMEKGVMCLVWSSSKIEGPSTTLSFLGICLDTTRMEVRLPEGKLAQLLMLLLEWRAKRKCKQRDLLSLIGRLSHVSTVVLTGRIFLRRMIETCVSFITGSILMSIFDQIWSGGLPFWKGGTGAV